MSEDELLDRVQEQFGFTNFVLIGLTPSEHGDKDMDDMHTITTPMLPPFALMALLHSALGEIMYDLLDEDVPAVH